MGEVAVFGADELEDAWEEAEHDGYDAEFGFCDFGGLGEDAWGGG